MGPTTAFLMEAAPPERRGFYTAFQAWTQHLSVLASGLVGFVLANALNQIRLFLPLRSQTLQLIPAIGELLIDLANALRMVRADQRFPLEYPLLRLQVVDLAMRIFNRRWSRVLT